MLRPMFAPNVRYAIRSLARTPAVTLTVVLTLGLGIGANTAVFSAIDSILLRPLPYNEPDRLVSVMETRTEAGERNLAPTRLADWNAQTGTFERITAYTMEDVTDTTGDSPVRVRWAGVAPGFLDVWRVAPALGRGFVPEDSAQRPTVVIISDRLWRSRFGGDPNVLEKTIRLGNPVAFPFSIVGVMPASFLFPDRDVDVWFPNFTAYAQAQNRNVPMYVAGVGRLRPGVTVDEARADLETIQARLAEQYPDTDRDVGVSLTPLDDRIVAGASGSLRLLFGAVSILLLIACTNIAALLLARAARRQHEVAIRYSLGASRGAMVAQALTEAGVLSFAGAFLGLVIAQGATSLFGALVPDLPRLDEIAVDGRVVAYTVASTVLVTLLCGLFPAIRNARATASLSHSGRSQVSPRHATQWLLVGVQATLCVMLLTGAGLLLRSFDQLARVDAGFDPSRVLAFRVSGSNFEYVNSDVPARILGTLDALRAMPGVESAASTYLLPGVVGRNQAEIELAGAGRENTESVTAELRIVSPSYFATMQIPLLTGELCSESSSAPRQAMVNRSFAEQLFPGAAVIGLQRVAATADRVVGVVGDARETGTNRNPVPTMYLCNRTPSAIPWFTVRTTGAPGAAAASVRAKLREIEPQRTVYDLAPLEEHIGDAYSENRLRTLLLTLFAGAALALTCLGVYGTLSYVVGLRRREVGLRVALGAQPRSVVLQFLRKALQVVGVACAAGLALSLASARLLSGMLYGVTAADPATLIAVLGIVIGIAALAALPPAIRASRTEPMQALREE